MENVYVLFMENRLVGVYTSHRKAMQTLILDTVRQNWKLDRYQFDFGIEYFTYVDDEGNETEYEIQEVAPDARA